VLFFDPEPSFFDQTDATFACGPNPSQYEKYVSSEYFSDTFDAVPEMKSIFGNVIPPIESVSCD
jgi:hypothetical protein